MKVSRSSLLAELNSKVCDIRFVRKTSNPNKPPTRRMICCNDMTLLNSYNGRTVLNFLPTNNPPRYNTANNNNIITWDIFMQNWRTISCDNVDLIQSWSEKDFWDVFREQYSVMSADEKIFFMNS